MKYATKIGYNVFVFDNLEDAVYLANLAKKGISVASNFETPTGYVIAKQKPEVSVTFIEDNQLVEEG